MPWFLGVTRLVPAIFDFRYTDSKCACAIGSATKWLDQNPTSPTSLTAMHSELTSISIQNTGCPHSGPSDSSWFLPEEQSEMVDAPLSKVGHGTRDM